jgi:hypothetical protein
VIESGFLIPTGVLMGEQRPGWDQLRGWMLPAGLLVVAVIAVVYGLSSQTPNLPAQSPHPSFDRITLPPADDHVVTTDKGDFSIANDGDAIVIAFKDSAGSHELARVTQTAEPAPSGSPPPPTAGSTGYVMICPQPADLRFVFGRLDRGGTIKLLGSDASGQGATDGLFLFVLDPSTAFADLIVTENGTKRLGFRATAFDRLPNSGARQPSGCFVSG